MKSMRLFSFDDPAHREAGVLLPWYVNGTLDEAERARVERHVGECVACGREVEGQRRLAEALRCAAPPSGVEEGLRSLHARLPSNAVSTFIAFFRLCDREEKPPETKTKKGKERKKHESHESVQKDIIAVNSQRTVAGRREHICHAASRCDGREHW